MATPEEVSQLYREVIDDVILRVRSYFLSMGVDEQVLRDLQTTWEGSLFGIDRSQPMLLPPLGSSNFQDLSSRISFPQQPGSNGSEIGQQDKFSDSFLPHFPSQLDGLPENTLPAKRAAASASDPLDSGKKAAESSDSTLGSDLDIEEDEEQEEGNDSTVSPSDSDLNSFVLCQYEKVTRVKNKWKCILKDGMMRLNQQDYAFHRATCEFEW